MPKVAEVIFYAPKNRELTIGAEAIHPEKRNMATGAQIRPSGVLQFYNGMFKTSDKKEIDHLRGTTSFAIGRIREISQDEADVVVGRPRANLVTDQATSSVGVA